MNNHKEIERFFKMYTAMLKPTKSWTPSPSKEELPPMKEFGTYTNTLDKTHDN